MIAPVRNLKTDITYWASTPDGFGGFTFGTPVALKGRWEQRTELFRNATGEEEVSEAIVFVSSDVAINGYLFEGTSIAADPTLLADAKLIKQFVRIPDLRNLSHDRRAFL